jgi:hypothetical protein
MNQHGHIKCCKWVPWQHLDGSWFALYFHRQRNIKFSFRRHILYWYNKINLLVVPKARSLRTKFQKSSCLWHENSIVGMDPEHNQHDVIDVIWRLPVWNVNIRRYLVSCTLQVWYNLRHSKEIYKSIFPFAGYLFPRSFHASNKSTSNDTKGFCWKDLPSWKCEMLDVIFTTMQMTHFRYNKTMNI